MKYMTLSFIIERKGLLRVKNGPLFTNNNIVIDQKTKWAEVPVAGFMLGLDSEPHFILSLSRPVFIS